MARILCVDDEIVLCDLAQRFFTLRNHGVDVAESYKEAMERLEAGNYDIVLLDVHLPGARSGLDLLREIQQSHRDTRVVLMTGYPTLDAATEALRLGAFDLLVKPVDLYALEAVVVRAIEDKQQADEARRRQAVLEKHQGLLEKTLIDQIHGIREAHRYVSDAHIKSLSMLARAAEYHDEDSAFHIKRVGEFSRLIGKRLGLSDEDLEIIFHAAQMHDVGKVGIPYTVLAKPGPLNDDEFSLVREHCRVGYDLLKDEDHVYHRAAGVIALSHHERFDGKGYPNGLVGEDIPLFGRIVAVSDVYDALISSRTYKSAWPVAEAVEHIRSESGRHFDPRVVEAFLDSVEELEIARQRISREELASEVERNFFAQRDHLMRHHNGAYSGEVEQVLIRNLKERA